MDRAYGTLSIVAPSIPGMNSGVTILIIRFADLGILHDLLISNEINVFYLQGYHVLYFVRIFKLC